MRIFCPSEIVSNGGVTVNVCTLKCNDILMKHSDKIKLGLQLFIYFDLCFLWRNIKKSFLERRSWEVNFAMDTERTAFFSIENMFSNMLFVGFS